VNGVGFCVCIQFEKNGFAQWLGSDTLRQPKQLHALVIFLQFLRWQVDKIDLDRSFEILNAILLFSCRCFCSGAARGRARPPKLGSQENSWLRR